MSAIRLVLRLPAPGEASLIHAVFGRRQRQVADWFAASRGLTATLEALATGNRLALTRDKWKGRLFTAVIARVVRHWWGDEAGPHMEWQLRAHRSCGNL